MITSAISANGSLLHCRGAWVVEQGSTKSSSGDPTHNYTGNERVGKEVPVSVELTVHCAV